MGEGGMKFSDILLSPSSLSLYKKCPRAFYYHKILSVPSIVRHIPALDFGLLVHRAIAHYYSIIPNSLSPSEVDMWVVKACKDVSEALSNYLIQHMRHFIKFERRRLEWHISPKPIAIEKKCVKPPFKGIVDAIFRKGKDIVVVDWKTGYSRAPRLDESLLIQGAIYKYLTDAKEVYFVFLRYGNIIKHPEDYTVDSIKTVIDDIYDRIGSNDFPRNEGEYCSECEYSIYCQAEKRGLTLWVM